MKAVKTLGEVLYHVYDADNDRKWCILYLPLHDDFEDPDRWWSAFDVVEEKNIQPLGSLKSYHTPY